MDFRSGKDDNMPLVTIGVLSYNNAPYILYTLNSIYNQTYQNIELFIVEDYSKDNSLQIINDWIKQNNIKCTLILHEKNYGIAKGCNDVVSGSKGKYISLFGSDDIMFEKRIEQLVEEMESVDESYGICYSKFQQINEAGETMEEFKITENKEGILFEEFFHRTFTIPAPTVLIRKNIFQKVGLYDERLAAEDYGMWMKVLPFFKVKFCPHVAVKYRVSQEKRYTSEQLKQRIEWFHRDRIYIYFTCLKRIKKEPQWHSVRTAIGKKIGFHLLRLKACKSVYFKKTFLYLLQNFFSPLPFKELLQLSIKQLFFKTEKEYFWTFE